MGNCVMCGSSIPDGQNCCSMCYGDPEYGRDGYYRQWLEEQDQWWQHVEEREIRWLEIEAAAVDDEAERLASEENIPNGEPAG